MVLSSRGGTNNFHGEAYEFFKNQALNASDWNSNRYSEPKGVFHDNVFGFTFGGPVMIPKVYHGKDKTFFFLNWEADRHRTLGYSNLTSVPTDLEKQGDFSQSLGPNGLPAQIFDPATGVLVNGVVERQVSRWKKFHQTAGTCSRRAIRVITPSPTAHRGQAPTM